MSFYPKLKLHQYYKENPTPSDFFSSRIPDQTLAVTLHNLNRAMNTCDQLGTFLDFGAGNGRCSRALIKYFKQGYGVEITHDQHLINITKEYKNFTALTGKFNPKKLKSKIDFFIMMDVFEHLTLKEVPGFMRQLKQIMAKNGVVYLITPNAISCGPAELSGIYHLRHKYGHHKHYTEVELTKIFASAGFAKIFSGYEDTKFRLFIRWLNLGASFLDKKLEKIELYKFISWPGIWMINVVFFLLSPIVNFIELHHQNDWQNNRTIYIAFKKLS